MKNVTLNKKINCWEYNNCGREPGGFNSQNGNICPASIETLAEGINRGKNAGRCCWAISGTLCHGLKQGTKTEKLEKCVKCDFFNKVQEEEHRCFTIFSEILSRQNKFSL